MRTGKAALGNGVTMAPLHGVMACCFTPLMFDLFVETIFVLVSSITYRSPLDMKSLHKIFVGDVQHCGVSVIVHFIAPISWAVIYLSGGSESLLYGYSRWCEDQGGVCMGGCVSDLFGPFYDRSRNGNVCCVAFGPPAILVRLVHEMLQSVLCFEQAYS